VIPEDTEDEESDESGRHQPFYRYVKRKLGSVQEHKKRERSTSFEEEKKEEKVLPMRKYTTVNVEHPPLIDA